MAEDTARDRVESGDSGRECNAVIRPEGPDAAALFFRCFGRVNHGGGHSDVSTQMGVLHPLAPMACATLFGYWGMGSGDRTSR